MTTKIETKMKVTPTQPPDHSKPLYPQKYRMVNLFFGLALIFITLIQSTICADPVIIKKEYSTVSKTDMISLQLTEVSKDPKKPNLQPERNLDYRTDEASIKMVNDGYSVIYNLKEKDCWDAQDYLQDKQETHALFMLCKVYTVRIFLNFL